MMTETLYAGVGREVITPPKGTLLKGYPQKREGNVVADDLNATAIVLSDGNTQAVMVSLDWCVIDEEETANIRQAVAAQTGITPENITLHATHTHSGPSTFKTRGWGEKNYEYLDLVRPKIVQAIVQAQQSLQPARVGIGVTKTQTGINRREIDLEGNVLLGFNEWGARDDDLTVVRLEGEKETIATIVHLTAHPTSRGGEPSVSRDWPGVMMDRVEMVTGAKVLFLNGAFGNVAPRTNVGGATGDANNAAAEVGLMAATDALRAFNSIKEFRTLPLRVANGDIKLPLAPLPEKKEAQQKAETFAHAANDWGRDNAEYQYWSAVLEAHDRPPRTTRTVGQTIIQLGPIALVPFPGELFSEIALRVKKHSLFAHTLCVSTSNAHLGYLVTREARARGGYEVWVMRAFSEYLLGEHLDDALVTENVKLLNQLYLQENDYGSILARGKASRVID